MIGKCLHFNGIENKRMELFYEEGDIKLYNLQNHKEDDDPLYLELRNGYMFLVGRIEYGIDRIVNAIKNTNVEEFIKNNFVESLKKDTKVSLGFAEYLGMKDEAIKHNTEIDNKRKIEKQKREEEEKIAEQEAEEQYKKYINNIIKKIKEGNNISGRELVDLFDYCNIKLPLKTRGWCLNSLSMINIVKRQYRYRGNSSIVIFKYIDLLIEKIQ